MYKHIKHITISDRVITFETDNKSGTIISTESLDFDVKKYDEKIEYESSFTKITINRSFLTVTKDGETILRFYIPKPVRYYIEKDIRLKGSFDLEYRKHLRTEYDNTKHVLANLNCVDTDCDAFYKIVKKIERYSKGIHNQPILSVFYDAAEDIIRYVIISNNSVVESGYEPMTEKTCEELPNIFNLDD